MVDPYKVRADTYRQDLLHLMGDYNGAVYLEIDVAKA